MKYVYAIITLILIRVFFTVLDKFYGIKIHDLSQGMILGMVYWKVLNYNDKLKENELKKRP